MGKWRDQPETNVQYLTNEFLASVRECPDSLSVAFLWAVLLPAAFFCWFFEDWL